MIEIVRQLQLPALSLILLMAAAAKLSRVLRPGSASAGLGPTELFPVRLRRPAAFLVSLTELGLGVALIATAGGHSDPVRVAATASRLMTALFFLVSMCALVEMRDRRPDVGCGCFGNLSTRPAGFRSIIRAGILAGAALATIGVGPARLPPPSLRAAADLGLLVAELLLLAVISPEVGEALVRLGYTEPCELRRTPPERALAALRRNSHWRRYASVITSDHPADMWRELCWWYVVYPGRPDGVASDIVFAVQVKQHRPGIQSAVVPHGPAPDGLPVAAGSTDRVPGKGSGSRVAGPGPGGQGSAPIPGQRGASPVPDGSGSVPSGQI